MLTLDPRRPREEAGKQDAEIVTSGGGVEVKGEVVGGFKVLKTYQPVEVGWPYWMIELAIRTGCP